MTTKITLADIQRTIDGVAELANRNRWKSNAQWTRAVNNGLCRLAQSKGLDTCARSCASARWREYLFDVLCLETRDSDVEGQPQEYLDSPLVVECEWGNRACITHDFEKLLLARADVRLMIFQASGAKRAEAIIEHLLNYVRVYRRSATGDRYIFAVYCASTDSLMYREYIHQLPERREVKAA